MCHGGPRPTQVLSTWRAYVVVVGSEAVCNLKATSGDRHNSRLRRAGPRLRPQQPSWSAEPGSASERKKSIPGQSFGELPPCGSQWAELGQAEESRFSNLGPREAVNAEQELQSRPLEDSYRSPECAREVLGVAHVLRLCPAPSTLG